MVKVVGVRFKKAGKIYYFDPDKIDINQNDFVIVETARGLEFGVVAVGPKEVEENEIISPLKPVLRLAEDKDFEIHKENKEKAKEAAKITAVNLISILKNAVSDLDRVKRIVSVHGYVNSTPGFTEQPYVIDGASELLVEVFGDKGKHSRCAVSAPSLPLNICVEIELIAEIS